MAVHISESKGVGGVGGGGWGWETGEVGPMNILGRK